MIQAAVFMGSKSGEAGVRPCMDVLKKLGVNVKFVITSAHRTPKRTEELFE